MSLYTPPALNAVDFALEVQPSHSVVPYDISLSVHTVPALNAVDFALTTYTPPTYNTIDFEFLPEAGGATGQSKVWTGASWVAKPVKWYNGSTWVVKPVKSWNGSSWVVTPY